MYFSTQWRARHGAAALAMCGALLSWAPDAGAAAPTPAAGPGQDMLDDFGRLAQMRPRRCAAAEPALPVAGWHEGEPRCAWQGRLMLRSWTSAPLAAGDCVSPAALWWRWARERYPGAQLPSVAWHRAWTAQQLANGSGDERHIALVVRSADARWLLREWRWRPAERPATRRWQEGRWQLLAQAAQRMAQAAPLAGGADGQAQPSLRAAWQHMLGQTAGEVVGDQWRWWSPAGCLAIDSVGVAQASFQLPYLVEDSRAEQRAAVQLLLARRQPGAVWLRPFGLAEAARQSKEGLARYKAVWREPGWVRGLLWIPTKGGGPVLRMRMSVPAPEHGAATALAAQAVEQALETMSKLVGQVDG